MAPLIPLFTLAVLALGSCQYVGEEQTTDLLPALRRVPRRWELRAQRPRDSYEEDQGVVQRSSPAPPAYSLAANPFFQPVQVSVKLGGNEPGSVPVVVVPIPVPMHQPQSSGCDAVANRKQYNVNSGEGSYEEIAPVQRPRGERPPARWKAPTSGLYDEEYAEPVSSSLGRRPPPEQPRRPQYRPREQQYDQPPEQQYEQPREQPEQFLPAQPYEPDDKVDGVPPQFEPIASSQQLVEEFRAQSPKAPELPPMLLSQFDGSERAPITDASQLVKVKAVEITSNDLSPKNVAVQSAVSSSSRSAPSLSADASLPYGSPLGTNRGGRDPPRPRFDNLPMMRARLMVTPADYTEPYAVWFDQASGAARVDFHGGSTTTFRTMMPDGRVQRVEVRIDRSGEGTSRRCAVSVGARATPADRAHPALPDLQQFTFGGYEETPQGRVEVWRRTVAGRAGELGAARGEALTTRHELRLLRAAGDRAMPLRYKVAVDSSVLGPDTDGYEHHYSPLQPEEAKPFDSKFFEVNMNEECDTTEQLNASSSEDMARLEPLREFMLPHRDLRYDEVFRKFKEQFGRQYVDEKEEAVRKNVVIQSTRFVSAGNRQGSTAELGVNFLGDRLAKEVRRLQGTEVEAERLPGEAFPHSRDDVRVEEKRLPSGFDWRQRGGVTPVRYQGECSSCWAFAVAGAVEGALFRVSRRLVALSEQSMVDCAQPFGGKGCSGTWPSHAYNYVETRGLPALEEYPSYKAKVGKCVDESVPSQTRISSHVNVTSLSVPALKVAIRRHAPSVVIVDADCKSFISYKSGVLYDDRCGKTLRKLHHAVLAVGWGERQGEPYFILKNSWSDKWGKNGYIRVHARSNTCGVLTKPSYPRLEEPDVAQPLRKGARRQRTVRWNLDE